MLILLANRDLIPLITCLNLSIFLFIMGLVGIIWNKSNFMKMLLCIELMFFSIGLNIAFFSIYGHNLNGQMLVLLIITAAAAETAIGLSILIVAYRLGNRVTYDSLINLRG